ncbi:ABC transporter ATP-binding protein [Lichenifustis flavocetrariae]|uniref:ABC transporter ATP-binding protein n=1 Tax=Lichenifustis flavocetrariae TaxID=2949735 RepID=A0AA41YQN5_9HYPH|nr:ABC transporter ATP-binding protein [Lichenifustis flavocetrariae]MCW6506771.1 ABC transporter ATP-binding protein [Lichenifustis flavocetrariae]
MSLPAPATALLVAEAVTAGYDPDLPIVRGASLRVAPGEILAVLGPNGAGKSTFIKALAGIVPIGSGHVLLGDHDITHVAPHLRPRMGLAFVPQTENVFGTLSVTDNLKIAGDALADRTVAASRMAEMFDAFPDLAHARALQAGRLSGGQRQMLAVARALIGRPRVLMLDEPSAGLSPKLVSEVFRRLDRIRESGVAIVLVEQNVRAALALADRALVLVEGLNRHEGLARSMADDPVVAELYLGIHRRAAEALV